MSGPGDYEVIASTACVDKKCPEVLRDPGTGRVGVRGYVSSAPGEEQEQIAWMSPEQWAVLAAAVS